MDKYFFLYQLRDLPQVPLILHRLRMENIVFRKIGKSLFIKREDIETIR